MRLNRYSGPRGYFVFELLHPFHRPDLDYSFFDAATRETDSLSLLRTAKGINSLAPPPEDRQEPRVESWLTIGYTGRFSDDLLRICVDMFHVMNGRSTRAR